MVSVGSDPTYLSVIFSGGTQIHKHLHVTINRFPGFQSCEKRSGVKTHRYAYTHTIVILHKVLVKYRVRLHNVLCGRRPDRCPVRVEQL